MSYRAPWYIVCSLNYIDKGKRFFWGLIFSVLKFLCCALKLSGKIKYIKIPFLCWSFGCVKMCVCSRSQTAHSLHFNIFYFAYSTVFLGWWFFVAQYLFIWLYDIVFLLITKVSNSILFSIIGLIGLKSLPSLRDLLYNKVEYYWTLGGLIFKCMG